MGDTSFNCDNFYLILETMNCTILSSLDDLSKLLVIDQFMNIKSQKAKHRDESEYQKRSIKTQLASTILQYKESPEGLKMIQKLISFAKNNRLLYNYGISRPKSLEVHLEYYLKFIEANFVKTEYFKYKVQNEGNNIKIVAKQTIYKGEVINGLSGTAFELRENENIILNKQKIDYLSVETGQRRKNKLLFGPVALLKHQCDANCSYVFAKNGIVYIIAKRRIEEKEELFCCYGQNYFGLKNIDCKCETCIKSKYEVEIFKYLKML